MFTISAFSHLVDGLVAIHRQKMTAALLDDLPEATRRDIGLPPRDGQRSRQFRDGRVQR